MDATDIRWKQRFENFQAAYRMLLQAAEANQQSADSDLIRMALIKAFEMTFELSWEVIKDYLKYNGIDVKLPREVIKQAFATDILVDGQLWIDMLEERNLMAHTYDETRARIAVDHICRRYLVGLKQLHDYLQARLA